MKTLQHHTWSIIASIFYGTLLISGISFLAVGGYFTREVGTADFILMSIAVWRLTRLFTYDAITTFIRDWFEGAPPSSLAGALAHPYYLSMVHRTLVWSYGGVLLFLYTLHLASTLDTRNFRNGIILPGAI
jgi:hypothetical protein